MGARLAAMRVRSQCGAGKIGTRKTLPDAAEIGGLVPTGVPTLAKSSPFYL